ncbi:hypothetical protein ADEAN_000916900 [Angomonas deanei]|uniref:SAM-dependent MTase RsmB/NOP-type domain-containing protein n=1 Tax=Angomonas deanei TaxID=59799 RepID=A0A7G2CR66_9TRYP|nr:hypothetical protein ADEAN_000916900 [Angomonas deanei]
MRRQEESPEVLGVGATVWRDCFPPSEEEYQRIGRPLQDHCRRVLPHKTNGMEGFFIALLRKVAPVRFTPEENNRETSKRLSDAALEDRPRTSSVVQALLSGGGPSLFHQNGYVLLAAHNSILTTRLQPLFETIQKSGPSNAADTARRLSDFFRTNQVQAVWRNQEGLSLLSNETLEVLRSITDGGAGGKNHTTERYREHFSHASQQYNKNNFFLSHQELLQCGLVVLNASNQLTEAGANYLSAYLQHHKTEQYRRVIHLPLKYFQWLLSSQKLLFDASNNSMGDQQGNPIPDPEKSALYTASNKRLSHLIKDNNNEESWLSKLSAQLLSGSSHQTSNTSSHSIFIENAIVMLDGETLRHNNSKVLTAAQNWSFPVSVELTRNQSNGIDAIAIQLRLSEHSRRRYIAMLGRVLSAQSRKVNSHFALSDPLGNSHQNERLMKQHVQAYNDTPQQSRPSEVNHFGGIDGDQRSMADQSRVLYGNPTKGGEENGSIFEI